MIIRFLSMITTCILTLSVAWWGYTYAQEAHLDQEYITAIKRMNTQGMTKYSDPLAFDPNGAVLREHAAKFLSEYWSKVEFKVMSTARYCEFKDIEQADKTLKNYLIQSCMLNIFYGSQGMFYPTRQLTKAEALVALIRVKEGKLKELDQEIRRENYTKRANELWLSKETDSSSQDRPITRYEMALLLHRSALQ